MILTFLHIIPSLFSAPDDLSVSDDMEKGVINSIKIEGVKGEGDYKLSDNKWDLSNSSTAGTYTVSFAGDEGKVEGNRALTGGANDNKVLMMIPQTLGDGAKVTINFTPTGKSAKEASFSLGGTTWAAGCHITYVLSTTKMLNLSMGTITYPDGWNSVNTNADNQIKSSYVNGDAIGMYVVDKYYKVIEANLKFTYNGSQWAVESGKEFKGSPQYNYFVYYPYQSEGLPGAPAKGTGATEENVALAKNFFANAIDTWKSSKLAADQNTLDKMNACDLQIAKAASLDEAGLNISFAMKHTMGLAEITLGAKTFDNNYYLSNYTSYTWKNGTTTFHAYAGISGHSFYKVSSYRYVALVKPDVTTDFLCDSTTDPDSWTVKVSVKPTANGVDRVAATSKRTSWPDISYTMEVGDIYYSDGAMTHQSEDLASDKKAIGIVGYLGSDYWTEKDTKDKGIGGHALVMCLRNVDSAGSTQEALDDYEQNGFNGTKVKNYIGKTFQFLTYRTPSVRPCINSKEDIVNSFNNAKGSGYTETNELISIYGKNAPAAFYAKSYTTLYPTSDLCTGWFLPSAGQYYAVMSNLGAPISEDWSGIAFGKNQGYFKNMTQITSNINKKMKIVGDFNYTEFFGRIAKSAWTSSENSNRYDCNAIGLFSRETTQEGAIRFVSYIGNGEGWNTDQYFHIRPFLAF